MQFRGDLLLQEYGRRRLYLQQVRGRLFGRFFCSAISFILLTKHFDFCSVVFILQHFGMNGNFRFIIVVPVKGIV